jgi:hypothetical protein
MLRDALLVMLLLLACNTQTAHAFFDLPWITPAAPIAGEAVSVNIRGGICDSIFEHQGYPQITREGNTIRLLEYGHHWDGELCIYDIGTLTEPIGTFPRGDYTLTVDFIYYNYPDGYATINLGVIPFTVTGAPPAMPVPSSHPLGLFALSFLISGLAIWALRMRRRSC